MRAKTRKRASRASCTTNLAADAAVLERLDQANARLNEGIALKRRVIETLRPSALTNLGLAASLRILCSETSAGLGIPIHAEIDEFSGDPDLELTIYRVVQEGLTNISKYARASEVRVRLESAGESVRLEVVDDGVGFDPTQSPVGKHGVTGMRFRVTSLGGQLTVTSRPGAGTTLAATLPVQSITEAGALAG
jgi:signal transduction histidine kinase